jgi:hypothetical protein
LSSFSGCAMAAPAARTAKPPPSATTGSARAQAHWTPLRRRPLRAPPAGGAVAALRTRHPDAWACATDNYKVARWKLAGSPTSLVHWSIPLCSSCWELGL